MQDDGEIRRARDGPFLHNTEPQAMSSLNLFHTNTSVVSRTSAEPQSFRAADLLELLNDPGECKERDVSRASDCCRASVCRAARARSCCTSVKEVGK